MFNITNFAQFENIEFTGEDNLIVFDHASNENQTIYDDLIASSPFKFCEFVTEVTSYFEEADVQAVQTASGYWPYSCNTGFTVSQNLYATDIREFCDTELS